MSKQKRPIVRTSPDWVHSGLRVGFHVLNLFPHVAERFAETLFCMPPRMRLGARDAARLAEGLSFSRTHAGRRLAGWSWGAGPTVYLVHGWGGRAGQLSAFVPPLLARGFSVVAIDLPAHGESQGRLTNLVEAAAALRHVVGTTAPAHAIVAHSFGAAATSLALRDGLRAQRVALIGPAAAPVDWTHRFGQALGISGEVMDGMRARTERHIGFRWADLDVTAQATSRTEPLLVVHDRDDLEVPFADGAAIAKAWPGARLLSTAGLGHRRILRDAAVIEAVCEFVADGQVASDRGCAVCGDPLADPATHLCARTLDAMLFDREARRAAAFAASA